MRNNELRQQSKSPDYNGQVAMKSQKNINSAVSFHLKTEHERDRGDEDHRSPDIGRSELRQTWQRPRIIHHGLPDVFNQKQKKKYGDQNKKDLIRDINKMVENSQYNMAQKYLQPLNYKDEEKMSRNPIKPIKKILKQATKIGQQLKEMPDMSIEKYLKNKTSAIKITQCITLEVVKRGHHTGTVKKMLHVPTLQLICVREQPVQSRNTIRDWTSLWQNKLMTLENSPFINIYNVHFNYPQGAVSILMEYFRGRSLLNLLDITITLPESVIRQISTQVLKHLKIFYQSTEMHFGGLSPSQIMITEDGQIKLAMGLFYHIPSIEVHNIYNLRGTTKTKFDFNSTLSKFMKNSIEKPLNIQVEKSLDVFKFGLMMLHAAIGSFQNFQQSAPIHENLRYIFSEAGQKHIERQNICCLIHSQLFVLQMNLPNNETDRNFRKPEPQKFISYIRLLKDRFSLHFVNFLCRCLQLSHNKRAKLPDLLESSFITTIHDNENQTVKIDLLDLLALGRGWNQQNIYESGTYQKLQNFLNHMLPVYYSCNKQLLIDLLTNGRNLMYSLGKEVGLNSQLLGKRLEQAIEQILKNSR